MAPEAIRDLLVADERARSGQGADEGAAVRAWDSLSQSDRQVLTTDEWWMNKLSYVFNIVRRSQEGT